MTAAAQPAPTLNVARGKTLPPRIILYGENGVGKTTLAASIGKPILVDIEGGAEAVDVDRYQWPIPDPPRARSLADVYNAIRTIAAGGMAYDTLILDGLDELERLIWQDLIRDQKDRNGVPFTSIENFGFGKGYTMAVEEWRKLADSLEFMRASRNMRIVLVGHSQIENVGNPTGDDWARFTLLLHKKASGFLLGWADLVGFVRMEIAVGSKPMDKDKALGVSTGVRILHLSPEAGFVAKARTAADIPAAGFELEKVNAWAGVEAALAEGAS